MITTMMQTAPLIRITKMFQFEAAHALWGYDGPCRNIHGHSYTLYVTVAGRPADDPGNPKHGMIIDFSVLKDIVHRHIISVFDHALLINDATPHVQLSEDNALFGKVLALPYQPTCENLVHDFATRLSNALPGDVGLFSLRLHETSTAYAEWYAHDQNDKGKSDR